MLLSKSSVSNITDHWSQTTNKIIILWDLQNVTQKHWSEQMLLEKWHQLAWQKVATNLQFVKKKKKKNTVSASAVK